MMTGVSSSQGMNRIRAVNSDNDMRAGWSRDISKAVASAMNSQKAITSHQKLELQRKAPGRSDESRLIGTSVIN